MTHLGTKLAAAGFVLTSIGCSASGVPGAGGASTAPSAPVVPAIPRMPDLNIFSDVTLSGVVFEETSTGRAFIPNVSVYCEPCGMGTHTFATTDKNGFYSFTGVWTDSSHFPTAILVRLDGYADPAGLPKPTPPNPSGPGCREVVVNGNTQFDMQLVRR